MKKFNSILLTLLLISVNLNAANLPGFGNKVYQFGFGNAARNVEDLRAYAAPVQKYSILPGRPVVATDQSGNRQMYSPNGNMVMSVSKDGTRTYSLSGVQKTLDKDGKLLSVSKNLTGTNRIDNYNEFGELISYKLTDMGGKVLSEYDKDDNKTRQYVYDGYGKNISAIINTLNGGRTVFDDKGLPAYELDYEGNRMARYEYNELNQLVSKTDAYGNVTKYDEKGNMTHTENKDGIVLVSYNYGYDKDNNYVLFTSFDPTTRSTTYFENGRQTVTKNYAGAIVTDYCWNLSKLLWSFNRETQETTYYGIDGKTLYTAFNDQLIQEFLYYKGALVGLFDARNNQVTVFQYERREVTLQLGTPGAPITSERQAIKEIGSNESNHVWGTYEGVDGFEPYDPGPRPTAEDIIRWIEDGLIANKFIGSPL
jgi:YD repeat-containing protein